MGNRALEEPLSGEQIAGRLSVGHSGVARRALAQPLLELFAAPPIPPLVRILTACNSGNSRVLGTRERAG